MGEASKYPIGIRMVIILGAPMLFWAFVLTMCSVPSRRDKPDRVGLNAGPALASDPSIGRLLA